MLKVFTLYMNHQQLHRWQEKVFDFSVYTSYFLIVISSLGFSATAPKYLETIDYYVRIYICLFLMWRFNPLKQTYEFTDLDRKIAFSAGDKAPKQVADLINKIKEQGLNMKKPIKFKVDSNESIEHQYGDTECGVYSIFFIIHMLEDTMTEHYLKTHILKDEYMQKFRHIYFNDPLI